MKALSVILMLFFCSTLIFAQEKTLVGNGFDNGGFGGPVIKFTQINGEFGVLVGGRGGWIMNHTFILGLGGYGLANNIDVEDLLYKNRINMGYGGLEMEFIVNSDDIMHFTAMVLIGGGGVMYTGLVDDNCLWSWDWDGFESPTKTFFIAEPGINLELNITSFFRLGFGGSYRFISSLDSEYLTNSDLDGFSGVLAFKFGAF